MMSYVYVPVIQKELDIFRETVWNTHRVRKQKNKELPTGVPEHIYTCPNQYGGEKCGHVITEEQLREVAEFSGVLDNTDDFLDDTFRQECQRHIPDTDDIKPAQASNAYLFLRDNFDVNKLMSM